MTCNLYSSIEAAKEAMEKLSTETKEYFERQTELINKAFTVDEQTTKTKPEIKAIVVHRFLKNDTIKDLEKDKKMNRAEAISEIDCVLFEQDHLNRKEVMKALKQPVTLAEFLGWEEGKEYRRGGNIFKVDGNHLLDKRPNGSWCNTNCQTFELIDLRQAKKVERPKLRAYHVKDEYSYDCLIKELVEKGYTKTLGGYLTIKTSYYNLVKETTRNYIYLHDNDRVSFSHELVRDGYDIIEYHKEEPKYYAKIKGWENIEYRPHYWIKADIRNRWDKKLRKYINSNLDTSFPAFKEAYTKSQWAELGIDEDNAEFEVESK